MNERPQPEAPDYDIRRDPAFIVAAGSLITASSIVVNLLTEADVKQPLAEILAGGFLALAAYAGNKVVNNFRSRNQE
jgi:hypothetical protein